MRPALAALLFMTLGASLVPVGDAFAKEISRVTMIEPTLVAFARFLTGAAFFLPLALWRRQIPKLTVHFVFAQALRGVFITGGISCMVTAVSHAPLADVFGAFFIAPAIATGLAALVLKEKVTRLDLLSLGLGLIGVLMVARPGAEMNIGLLWALSGGVFYGCFNAATRWSAGFTPPLAQIAGQLVFGALFTAPLAITHVGQMGSALAPAWFRCRIGHGEFLSGDGLCAGEGGSAFAADLSAIAKRGADWSRGFWRCAGCDCCRRARADRLCRAGDQAAGRGSPISRDPAAPVIFAVMISPTG